MPARHSYLQGQHALQRWATSKQTLQTAETHVSWDWQEASKGLGWRLDSWPTCEGLSGVHVTPAGLQRLCCF